jgi:hypothetical protein
MPEHLDPLHNPDDWRRCERERRRCSRRLAELQGTATPYEPLGGDLAVVEERPVDDDDTD